MEKTANLLDYVEWRGDLDFKQAAFCEVDALILCQLSYLNLETLVSPDLKTHVHIKTLWENFRDSGDFESRTDMGVLISESTVHLLELCAQSRRFGNLEVSGFVNKIDLKNEEQFSAVTFFEQSANRFPFVAFRGTDDTIVGWKEDFNLASKIVPSQNDALLYLSSVAKASRGKILAGGHSKGGNLAVYASAFAAPKVRRRIQRIYNFDGPGFSRQIIQSEQMKTIGPLVRSYYPKFSIVGRLFYHGGGHRVVESEAFGIMQHEPFSWHVLPASFEEIEGFDKASEVFYRTFNEWVENISPEKKSLFVETLFNIISASGARTNTELGKNRFKNATTIFKAMGKIDRETREEITQMLKNLADIAARNIITD